MKRLPSNNDYAVTEDGRVYSLKNNQPRELKGGKDKDGYRYVLIYNQGNRKTVKIHSLVAEAFLGQRPKGMEVRHLDGNNQNNHVSNLTYGTRSENRQDRVIHGTQPNRKLTDADVVDIRWLLSMGVTTRDVGDMFNIKGSHAWKIGKGKVFSYVGG